MLCVETVGRIRRLHLVEGRPIKEIVRLLKDSRNTVRRVSSVQFTFLYERMPWDYLWPPQNNHNGRNGWQLDSA